MYRYLTLSWTHEPRFMRMWGWGGGRGACLFNEAPAGMQGCKQTKRNTSAGRPRPNTCIIQYIYR